MHYSSVLQGGENYFGDLLLVHEISIYRKLYLYFTDSIVLQTFHTHILLTRPFLSTEIGSGDLSSISKFTLLSFGSHLFRSRMSCVFKKKYLLLRICSILLSPLRLMYVGMLLRRRFHSAIVRAFSALVNLYA